MIKLIRLIAVTECLIGFVVILGLSAHPVFAPSTHPLRVFAFDFITAVIAISLGLGLFLLKESARKVLVYFSGYIVMEKILTFMGVISLSGKVLTEFFGISVNIVSLIYHGVIVWFFTRNPVKLFFHKK